MLEMLTQLWLQLRLWDEPSPIAQPSGAQGGDEVEAPGDAAAMARAYHKGHWGDGGERHTGTHGVCRTPK